MSKAFTEQGSLDDIPFPVEASFAMRPGLRLHEGVLCERDHRFAAYQDHLETRIEQQRLPLWLAANDVLDRALDEAGIALQGEIGAYPVAVVNANFRDRAIWLRRQIQDDWAIIGPTNKSPSGGANASALAFAIAMPSGWDPSSKLGLDFASIHRPVPETTRLMAAAPALLSTILTKGPYRRYVWTLSDSAALSRHPDDACTQDPNASIWFRCERQTTVPLPHSGCALFLIRLYVAPLNQVLDLKAGRRQRLQTALASMSDAVIDYKNLATLRQRVLSGAF